MASDWVVSLERVSKSFKGVPLFEDVSYAFKQGRAYGIIGPNGSGKSVLFKLLCGFVRPDSGDVTVSPKFQAPGADYPQAFGVLIDRPGYIAHKTGLANLMALAAIRRVASESQVKDYMAQFGLAAHMNRKVATYSLGMRQKLGLIQAVMEGQQVLILDEPFNALDRASAEHLSGFLVSHLAQGGTLFLTSHNTEDIVRLSTDVLRIDNMSLLAD